ncbi:23178_t:CDS:1, partial [Cetraspora pellucida]
MSTSYFIIDSSSKSSLENIQYFKKTEKSVNNSKERLKKQKHEFDQKLNNDLETLKP